MGVPGLLQHLRPFSEAKRASDFRGFRLACDAYSWIHRAASSCAEDLFKGRETTRLVQSIDNRIRLFEHYGVELYFVFDGSSIAMKRDVEKQRRARRKMAADRATKTPSRQNIVSAVDITAHHAAMVIALLKQRQIKFVVAPFEADAQMVWLENNGFVSGIISEDSDLLVFGAKRLLTKWDGPDCVEVNAAKLAAPFTDLRFLRALAIISGCDYSRGVTGLGVIKSSALIQRFGNDLEAVLESLRSSGKIDADFVDAARRADLAFQYQRVWDVEQKLLTHLADPAGEELADEVVGTRMPRVDAHRIALGMVDPHDLSKQLVVSPLVSQYVSRLKPVAPAPKQVSVTRLLERRMPITRASGSSSFFRNKENILFKKNVTAVPAVQVARESTLRDARLPMASLNSSTSANSAVSSMSSASSVSSGVSASSTASLSSQSSLKRESTFEDPPAKMPSKYSFLNKFRYEKPISE